MAVPPDSSRRIQWGILGAGHIAATVGADIVRSSDSDVAAVAREAGLFCMEAMWMRFNPLIRQAVDLARDGAIGDLISVHADLSAPFPFDPRHRLYDLAAGGGALLDLGIYPTHLVWMF